MVKAVHVWLQQSTCPIKYHAVKGREDVDPLIHKPGNTLGGGSPSRPGDFITWGSKGKGKAVQLQAWSGSEGSRKLRFPDYMTTAQDGGKVVSLTHRPPLPPGNTPGTHFC